MSNKFKYLLIFVIILVLTSVTMIAYRMFFQFDSKDIRIYVQEEASKYTDQTGVYNIIMYGVESILRNSAQTRQVLTSARATGTDKEQELVNAAINQCKAFSYLPK